MAVREQYHRNIQISTNLSPAVAVQYSVLKLEAGELMQMQTKRGPLTRTRLLHLCSKLLLQQS